MSVEIADSQVFGIVNLSAQDTLVSVIKTQLCRVSGAHRVKVDAHGLDIPLHPAAGGLIIPEGRVQHAAEFKFMLKHVKGNVRILNRVSVFVLYLDLKVALAHLFDPIQCRGTPGRVFG